MGRSCVAVAVAFAVFGLTFRPVTRAENEPIAPPVAPAVQPTLRELLTALNQENSPDVGPLIWRLLVAMSKARGQGIGPSEFLAAAYRQERSTAPEAAAIQNCLLTAWSGAQGLGIFTPENLALMEQGETPLVTRGLGKGIPVTLDLNHLPVATVSALPVAGRSSSGMLIIESVSSDTLPLANRQLEPMPDQPSEPYVTNAVDAHLKQLIPLDAYGLRNFNIRLEAVEPKIVSFFFEDRRAQHFRLVNQYDSQKGWLHSMERCDWAVRSASPTSKPIPGTRQQAILLVTKRFASIYLDPESIFSRNYRLLVRVPAEVMQLEKLPPDRQALYAIPTPTPLPTKNIPRSQ